MPKSDHLGEFELHVLAALMRLGDEAYGVTIRREIEARAGRTASIGSVYATLDRLEAKGLVRFTDSTPVAERGGRVRKFVRPTPEGLRVLRDSARAITRMLRGLGLGLNG